MVTRQMNIRQFANFTKRFPKQMEKAGIEINEILAKSYQRRIRSRAKGRLKNIKAVAKGKLLIEIQYPNKETARIAEVVNKGLFPKKKIPVQLMEASRAGIETVGKKSEDVIGKIPHPVFVHAKPSTAKGFLTKSANTLKQNTPALIEKKLQETFNAI